MTKRNEVMSLRAFRLAIPAALCASKLHFSHEQTLYTKSREITFPIGLRLNKSYILIKN